GHRTIRTRSIRPLYTCSDRVRYDILKRPQDRGDRVMSEPEQGQKFRLDWMISVDDHVLEPPGVWQDRMPAKYKDAAPKMVTEGGTEFWRYEGRLFPTSGLSA